MLATTAYDAPASGYTFAMSKTREVFHQAKIPTEYVLLSGNCHVDDARNVVVQEFLLSKCDDLVFIDADVLWEPSDLLKLCQYEADLVGGVYPHRRDDARSGKKMPVRLVGGMTKPREDGLLEVEGVPTGFMRIRRHVIETLVKDADHFRKTSDFRSLIPILFQRTFHDGVRWGGDIHFCNLWRATGGEIYTDPEMRFGHEAKSVVYDSLAAWMRRQHGTTLLHMVNEIRAGRCILSLFSEARQYVGNEEWGALEDVLSLCAFVKADGPIIEAGSGLTTIVLAAANPKQTVYCLEHDPLRAAHTKKMALEANVLNIGLCLQPIRNGWYDMSDLTELPEHFSLGLNDGPPRDFSSRMGFFEHFGRRTNTIICDDAADAGYRVQMLEWAIAHNRTVDFVGDRAALIRRHK